MLKVYEIFFRYLLEKLFFSQNIFASIEQFATSGLTGL